MSIRLLRKPAAGEGMPATEAAAPASLEAAPLSPARDQLARQIGLLATAADELAEAVKPVNRLAAVKQERDAVMAELVELRRQDEAVLGTWLAEGAIGPRPMASDRTLAIEHRLAGLIRDGAAADAAFPAATAAYERCAELVKTLGALRDDAVSRVAVEACQTYAATARAALSLYLLHKARLGGVQEALTRRGYGGSGMPGALNAAAQIRELMREIEKGVELPPDFVSGHALLDALAQDATATIEAVLPGDDPAPAGIAA